MDMAAAGQTSGAQALAAAVWDTTVRGFVRATPSLQTSRGRFAYRELLEGLPKAEEQEMVRRRTPPDAERRAASRLAGAALPLHQL
ncbi:hypothetical protein [Streptomyces sp. ICC1]|uniref:hypothetical protein n=1 Tax=Streptomyces sp. ICC1 TaxID=2099583 RepID=UPI0013A6E389|nr:hypothetical protein [Streptomyces sp. ICC1]